MFRRTMNFNEALRQFTRVMDKLPNDKSVYIQRGLVYQEMGNHSYAIYDFKKAIEIDNRYDTAFFLLGVSKLKSQQVESAILDFNQAQLLCKTTEALAGILDGLG